MHELTLALILLLAFQLKHFLADFPLQTPYMLQKFRRKGWALPLAAHAGVHAVITFVIITIAADFSRGLLAAAVDFVLHFTMDRIKASPDLLGRFKNLTASEYMDANVTQRLHNKYFWWSLGIDQTVHHLTHYAIIFFIVF